MNCWLHTPPEHNAHSVLQYPGILVCTFGISTHVSTIRFDDLLIYRLRWHPLCHTIQTKHQIIRSTSHTCSVPVPISAVPPWEESWNDTQWIGWHSYEFNSQNPSSITTSRLLKYRGISSATLLGDLFHIQKDCKIGRMHVRMENSEQTTVIIYLLKRRTKPKNFFIIISQWTCHWACDLLSDEY